MKQSNNNKNDNKMTITNYQGCTRFSGKKETHFSERYTTVFDYQTGSLTILRVTKEYVQQGAAEREYCVGEDGKRIPNTYVQYCTNTLEEICAKIKEYSIHGFKVQGSDAQKEHQQKSINVYTQFAGQRIFKGSIKNGIWTKATK